jgi:hypothetical protein
MVPTPPFRQTAILDSTKASALRKEDMMLLPRRWRSSWLWASRLYRLGRKLWNRVEVNWTVFTADRASVQLKSGNKIRR